MIALVARLLGVREATAKLLAVLLGAGCLIALYGALWARGEHFRAEAATAKATADRQAAAYRETYNRTFLQHFKAKLAEEARTRGIRENADHDLFDATLAARDRAAAYAARPPVPAGHRRSRFRCCRPKQSARRRRSCRAA
jgi:hypothetical protein